MIRNQGKRRRPGRPTLQEELEIQNKIKPYFEIGLEVDDVESKTGIDAKTVRKYYGDWIQRLLENYIEDFAERQKIVKVRTIISINSIIYNLRAQLNQITKAKISADQNEIREIVEKRLDGVLDIMSEFPADQIIIYSYKNFKT